ncbi:hypothetical protein P256_01452 [Acinetobacter nectaris CIP 110549]|uniref:Lysine exporter LysO family protein n=1 Tax=Acinetobacter nectaris CIP 110549 TaxID=1392540 RepID=V2TP80_9GAMM|nr:lysine exporter LysO family protein [Acinetobacter nectaris]ESK39332.1 hypothetical protein P256_01452 [Acinetobacter nectaris CIP 110549]
MLAVLISSLLPLFIFLALGWGSARIWTMSLKQKLVKSIGYVVWVLLITVGYEFGIVLADPSIGIKVCVDAFLYASILSIVTFILLYFQFFQNKSSVLEKQKSVKQFKDILSPIKECICAISMVVIGVLLYQYMPNILSHIPLTTYLLYVVVFLIGIDLASVKLEKITFQHIYVPCMSLVALFVASGIACTLLSYNFMTLMMAGSGLGWFSLSGSLVAKLSTNELGSFTLLTDLIRELYAIILLYLFGQYRSQAVIGVCGATAMDSTLPFVKKNCNDIDVQIAIFSGFVLTIAAPFLITFFASMR